MLRLTIHSILKPWMFRNACADRIRCFEQIRESIIASELGDLHHHGIPPSSSEGVVASGISD
jgi:hypothetical protein